jgi:mannose-6-phosphate isomerase-like protein (cupin superfamily)
MTESTALAQPIRLGRQMIVHLSPELELGLLRVDDSYWSHLSGRPELAEGRVLSVFDYDESWTWWERHPVGDELLYVLEGEINFQLDDGVSTRILRVRAGEGAIVPTGVWHRAEVPTPSRLLFVTPTPARTEQRAA